MRTTQKAKTIQPRTQEREDLQLPALDQEDLKLTSRANKTLSAKGMFHSVTVWLAVVGLFGQVICVPVRIKPRFQHDGHMEQDANQPTAKPGMIEETAKPHTKDSEHLRKLTDAIRTIHKTYKGHHAGDLALITAVIKNIQDNPEIIESKPVTPKVLDEKRKLETVDNLEEQNLREEEKKALMMISELEDEMERLKKELDFTKQEYRELEEGHKMTGPLVGQDGKSAEEKELLVVSHYEPTQSNTFLEKNGENGEKANMLDVTPEMIESSGQHRDEKNRPTEIEAGYFLPFPDDDKEESGDSMGDLPPSEDPRTAQELKQLNGPEASRRPGV